MTSVYYDDAQLVSGAAFIPWEKLRGSRILVTGATGLINSTLIRILTCANQRYGLGLQILALVRNEEKAREMLSDSVYQGTLLFLVGSMETLPEIEGNVDYIVHGASQTASGAFVAQPVETMKTAIQGTTAMLELAREKQVRGFVYMSSMETYGYPEKGHKVTEGDAGAIHALDVRNSYPLGKLISEALCYAYTREYGVPAMIIRLAQTFGPGIRRGDKRFFAYLAGCIRDKQDIVLKTKGETERNYLYTADAAAAILTILLRGTPGEAYNAANEKTYCSIAQMAERAAALAGTKVRFELENAGSSVYLNTLYMDLDASKLRALGWELCGGGYTVEEMLLRLLQGEEEGA